MSERLVEVEEGDRVHIRADAARHADDRHLFERGDRVLIDDTADVIEARDGAIVVKLDEQGVLKDEDDGFGANTFKVYEDGAVVAKWEVFDEDAVDDDDGVVFKPVNYQVAMLNSIERLDGE